MYRASFTPADRPHAPLHQSLQLPLHQKLGQQLGSWTGLLILGLALTSCSSTPGPTATPTETSAAAPIASPGSSPAETLAALPRLDGEATVVMTVKGGQIRIKVDGTKAPITAGNFVDLVQKGVYDGTVFHRVVKEPQPFVVQGGDPQSKDPAIPASEYGTGSYLDPQTKQPRYVPLEILPVEAKDHD